MTRSRAEWYDKANAYAEAWAALFQIEPTVANVALGLAVAEHETRCGDAWPGEHNWGAVTKGGLSVAQRAALAAAGVHPVMSPATAREASENAAEEALRAAGVGPAADQAIHVDSAPRTGAYFTFFGRFSSDVDGARYFLHVLAETRLFCRGILEQASRFADGGVIELASAMYRSHYYLGFHDPHVQGGDEANIDDYSRSLAALRPGILHALEAWTPGAEPPAVTEPATHDLGTTLGIQQALNAWCRSVDPPHEWAPLAEDGIEGPRTRQRVKDFQHAAGLTEDGIVGPKTRATLRSALA